MSIFRRITATVAFVAVAVFTSAQVEQPTMLVQTLDTLVNETSGLIFLNGKLWTHNDSGSEAKLFCIDSTSGQVVASKVIKGVSNNDWEDIAKDKSNVYIGNFGSVCNEKQILRIKIADLENPALDSIVPRIINFTYGNPDYPESNFEANNTRFDCEAMIAKDDTIFLFSKNWVDHKTFLYAIPNKANFTHTVLPIDTLELNYLITAADYDFVTNTVALAGYTYSTLDSKPHITLLTNFAGNNFFSGNVTNQEFSSPSSLTNQAGGITYNQIEGIAFRDSCRLWVSNERVEKSVSFFTLRIDPHLREFRITNPTIVNNAADEPTFPEEPLPIDIQIELSDTAVLVGETIRFTDLSTQEPRTWIWTFEGGEPATSNEQNPQVRYNEAGRFSVSLHAENESSSEIKHYENLVKVYESAEADFTAEITTINENNTVRFTNTSQNAESYAWTFENGEPATSNEQNPEIRYSSEGSFAVSLIACNPVSCDTIVKENFIVVNDILDIELARLAIFPNPTSDCLTVDSDGDFGFEIINAKGVIVMKSHKKNQPHTKIDISFLPAGMYIFKVEVGQKFYEIKFAKI